MKKFLFFILFLLCLPMMIQADKWKNIIYNGVQYNVSKEPTRLKGCKEYYKAYITHFRKKGMSYEGDVVVPDSFVYKDRFYRVWGFNGDGFCYSPNLTSVTLSEGASRFVKSSEFLQCPKLKRITLANPPDQIPWYGIVQTEHVSPDFEGVFIKKSDSRIHAFNMRYIKAKSLTVRLYVKNMDLSSGKENFFKKMSVDTLHLTLDGLATIQPSNDGGRVNTLIIDKMIPFNGEKAPSRVINLDVDNLVFGPNVTKVYPDTYKGPLNSITVKGNIKEISDQAFTDLSSLQTYDAGNSPAVAAMIEYRIGAELESRGEKEKALPHLRKASELGSAKGSELLAKYQDNAADWENTIAKSAQQGSAEAKEKLVAMEYCKRLREVYPSIAALAKANKIDTTLMKEVRMMSEYNDISLGLRFRTNANKTLKYKFPGYEDVCNKALDMLAYFKVSEQILKKYGEKYYYKYSRSYGGEYKTYFLTDDFNWDKGKINDAKNLASEYSTAAAQDFRPFFVNAVKQLTEKTNQLMALKEKQEKYIQEYNYKVDLKVAEEALEHKRKTDPDYMPIPTINTVKQGPHYRIRDTDSNYDDYDFYHFADGTTITVHHYHSEFLVTVDYYYYEGFENRKYYNAEDAAKAGWIWKKHGKVRTIGKEKTLLD